MSDAYTKRSPAEIEALKRDWMGDPCWDIEKTDGFEAHRDELLAFHRAEQAIWEEREAKDRQIELARLQAKANQLGCSVALAELIDGLQREVERLSNEVGRNNGPDTISYRLDRLQEAS